MTSRIAPTRVWELLWEPLNSVILRPIREDGENADGLNEGPE